MLQVGVWKCPHGYPATLLPKARKTLLPPAALMTVVRSVLQVGEHDPYFYFMAWSSEGGVGNEILGAFAMAVDESSLIHYTHCAFALTSMFLIRLCIHDGRVIRGACTDRSWSNPACSTHCNDGVNCCQHVSINSNLIYLHQCTSTVSPIYISAAKAASSSAEGAQISEIAAQISNSKNNSSCFVMTSNPASQMH